MQNIEHIIGVDLGKVRDFTAIAILEKNETRSQTFSPVYHANLPDGPNVTHVLRFLERVPLGTTYPDVVRRVGHLIGKLQEGRPDSARRTHLVLDATSGGIPVVELFRIADLPCMLYPVSITPGGSTFTADRCSVPKLDLVAGLQIALQNEEIHFAHDLRIASDLTDELASMRARPTPSGRASYEGRPHDDLVLAVALAWWKAKWDTPKIGEIRKRLI